MNLNVQHVRRVFSVLALYCLASCGMSEKQAFPDFCQSRGQRISGEERIAAALVWSSKQLGEGSRYNDSEFIKSFAIQRDKSPENDLTAARSFLKENPGCCRVTTPAYIREAWSYGRRNGYDIEDGHWIFDVQIKRKKDSKFVRREIVEVASGQCGEAQSVWRG